MTRSSVRDTDPHAADVRLDVERCVVDVDRLCFAPRVRDFAGPPASGGVILLVELLDGERMLAEGELVAVAQALHPTIDRSIR